MAMGCGVVESDFEACVWLLHLTSHVATGKCFPSPRLSLLICTWSRSGDDLRGRGDCRWRLARGSCSRTQRSRNFLLLDLTPGLDSGQWGCLTRMNPKEGVPASGRATWDQTQGKPDSERPSQGPPRQELLSCPGGGGGPGEGISEPHRHPAAPAASLGQSLLQLCVKPTRSVGVNVSGVDTGDADKGSRQRGARSHPQGQREERRRRGSRLRLPTCEWMCVCCSRLTTWPKVLPQTSQAKGRVPLWERRACTSSPCGVEKTWGWGQGMKPPGGGGWGPFPSVVGFPVCKVGLGGLEGPSCPF